MGPRGVRHQPHFEVKTHGRRHYLKADCSISLCKKRDLLVYYTRKVDPHHDVPKLVDQSIREISLNELLPRTVAASLRLDLRGNCHGAAIVAAGIFPQHFVSMQSMGLSIAKQNVTQIARHQLEAGDIIRLPGNAQHWTGHSFVYLDEDLSLSRNGINGVLNMHSTRSILKLYEYPTDALQSDDCRISFFRKNKEWNCPEALISIAIEWYQLMSETLHETHLDKLQALSLGIKTFIEQEKNAGNKTSSLIEASNYMWEEFYYAHRLKAWYLGRGPKPLELIFNEKLQELRKG